jgi:hypothetical protein
MISHKDSSAGAAGTYALSSSETFVCDYADTVSIASNSTDQVLFENTTGATEITPVFTLRYGDTVTFATDALDPSSATGAAVSLIADCAVRFSDLGTDTVSTAWWGFSLSANALTFNGPSDVLYESGGGDFVRQGWDSGNTLTGALQLGSNDTIDGGYNTSMSMTFDNYGLGNNLFLAPGHIGRTNITIEGGLTYFGQAVTVGYTFENVNP